MFPEHENLFLSATFVVECLVLAAISICLMIPKRRTCTLSVMFSLGSELVVVRHVIRARRPCVGSVHRGGAWYIHEAGQAGLLGISFEWLAGYQRL